MKKILTILAIFASLTLSAQTYVSGSFSAYDGTGNFGNKSMATVEVGKTWDVLSVGVAAGVTAFSNGDAYTEVRAGVTPFSKGRVSLTGTLGAGYVFDSNTKFLTEYCATGSLSIDKNWSASLFAGCYHFNGKYTASKYTFTGLGLTYSFK